VGPETGDEREKLTGLGTAPEQNGALRLNRII
jgi:hypothetical protein